MTKEEKMRHESKTQNYMLEGVLENLAKDLDLTLEKKEMETSNLAYLAKGPNFRLAYQRWDMDGNVEDESLRFLKENTAAYFTSTNTEEDTRPHLSYALLSLDPKELEKRRDFLVKLSSSDEDIAMRLALGKWRPSSREEVFSMTRVEAEEIIPFLKAHIKY